MEAAAADSVRERPARALSGVYASWSRAGIPFAVRLGPSSPNWTGGITASFGRPSPSTSDSCAVEALLVDLELHRRERRFGRRDWQSQVRQLLDETETWLVEARFAVSVLVRVVCRLGLGGPVDK